ncbi:MAG TPA: GNAT family N-acetyltransferase [Acidimicrobiales bacterium]|nr:GNAT family N-acetyltransferase [Acidimicrobiales bacterium]
MTAAADEPEIIDVHDESRFVYRDGDAQAELIYHLNGHRLVLIHTEVPDALGGRGLGGRLVTAALERAEREGLTVVPWCPFARDWLERHPDAGSRVTIDWESTRPARA